MIREVSHVCKLADNFPFQNPCITFKEPLSCLFSLIFKKMMEICYFYQLFLANMWCAEIANGTRFIEKRRFVLKQY